MVLVQLVQTSLVCYTLQGARDITVLVSSGVLHKDYKRLDSLQTELIDLLGLEEKHGNLAENAKGADILLGVSAAGAFTKKSWKTWLTTLSYSLWRTLTQKQHTLI